MKPISKQNTWRVNCFLTSLLIAGSNLVLCQPVANFSAEIVSGCAPIVVNFTDHSDGSPTQWKWNLGNGTFSNLQHPSVTYFNPGLYKITLWIKSGNHTDSVVKTDYIRVHQAPAVNFIAGEVTGCNPFTVNFSDSSKTNEGNITSWKWDFGDGLLSAQQHPAHTYSLAGNYSVTLKVTNSNGCAGTLRIPGYIQNSGMVAGFTSSIFAVCTPHKIVFHNTSTATGSFTSHWDFGDGTVAGINDPLHTYTAAGNYTVKLVVRNQYGCIDSQTSNVQVVLPVSAAFTGDNLVSCTPPVSVNFTNQNLAGNSYFWDFGDSTSSALSNPVHNFADTGNYSIKLIVRNINGCSDSLKKDSFVKINKPFFTFSNLPDSGCLPFSKSLSVAVSSSDTLTGYMWDFGDGSTSSQVAPQHTFTNSGYYNIKLVGTGVTGCKDTAYMQHAIRVDTKPAADFSANVRDDCASTIVRFTSLSTGTITSWLWDFGDHGASVEQHPSHVYTDTGWMTVQLLAINGGCADTAVFENYIYAKPAIANFTISMSCARPFVRTFLNFSKGATRWEWDFGDGTASADYAPLHTFPRDGFYSVKLTVWNDSTGCSYFRVKEVRIINVIPSFSASNTVVCKGSTISFVSGSGTGGIAKHTWNFGDTNREFSSGVNPAITHVYPNAGVYSVRLIIQDSLNCRDTLNKQMYIKVNGPKASFRVSIPVICVDAPVVFLDNSTAGASGPLRQWIWNYADGLADTLAAGPFQHSYNQPGNYRVSLTLTDSSGCSDKFILRPSLVVNEVSALFKVLDTVACPNLPVRFECPYYSQGAYYRWDFGDGTTSLLRNPVHTYASEAFYTAKLFVRNSYGCEDSFSISNAVRITQTIARFTMSDSFRICPPLLIHFTNQSASAVGAYWDFGDSSYSNEPEPSHFYTYPGVYTATLYAKGPGGCVKTMQQQIVVKGPKGTFTYGPLKLCRPYNVNFSINSADAVSYIWDFNDGATVAGTSSTVYHTYQDSGKFIPKIILVDDAGCRVPLTGRDTVNNLFANVSFTFPGNTVCGFDTVSFTSSTVSTDVITGYHWDFGDGATSGHKNPVHRYMLPGLYYPSLSVTTGYGCGAQYRSPMPVKVALSPFISINAVGRGCVPLISSISAVQNVADTSSVQWDWDFGNGTVSSMQNPPPQLYATAGLYTVRLTASNSGCSKTMQHVIEAYPLPVLKLSGDGVLCRGKSVSLQASGAAGYRWHPAAGLSCDTCAGTVAMPAITTRYTVTGTSLHGCSSRDTVAIHVQQPFNMTYSTQGQLCAGQKIRLQANGAGTYQWSPAYGLNSITTATPLAQPDSTTNYRVIGTDENGCFKDTGYVKLKVYPVPTVDAGVDKTTSAGLPLDLEAVYSNDVTQVNWSPTDGTFRNSLNIMTVKPTKNTEYTVEVTNPGGCSARDRLTVFVTCSNNNVFVPNLFSPNADGVNDMFFPRGTGVFKIKAMVIFNRWGETVFDKRSFDANDASAGWDGTYKGSKLTSDVFVYMIDLVCDNKTVLSLKGNVSLVR